jgi:hypothetical protein
MAVTKVEALKKEIGTARGIRNSDEGKYDMRFSTITNADPNRMSSYS